MVIQDIANGWEGLCVGLQLRNASTTATACREACCSDPKCEVWQWGNTREKASESGLGVCKTGRGLECSSDHFENFLVLAGQRVSHGAPSETFKLETGQWCTGTGMRQAELRAAQATQAALKECREVCYEDASCSVWQYSTVEGCWYGSADRCPHGGAAGAAGMVSGEKVVRTCGLGDAAPHLQTDYVKVFGVIGVVAFLLTGIAAVALVLRPMLREQSRGRGRSGSTSPSGPSPSRRQLFFGPRDEPSEDDGWDDEVDMFYGGKPKR